MAGDNGAAYVSIHHDMALGRRTNARMRLTAIGLLLDRGCGKPAQTIDFRSSAPITAEAVAVLSDEELEWADRISAKLSGRG